MEISQYIEFLKWRESETEREREGSIFSFFKFKNICSVQERKERWRERERKNERLEERESKIKKRRRY